MKPDTLYYDGNCPLCRAEIAKLRRFSKDRIALRNVHELEPGETEVAPSELLARLHLRTADGQWITGLDANIRAWRHTPFRWFWQLLAWPLIRWLSYPAYELWLRSRPKPVCDDGYCETRTEERSN